VAHGDAACRRYGEPAGQRTCPRRGGGVGPRARPSRRRAVQGVRRARADAAADAHSHRLGRRRHARARLRRRSAGAPLRVHSATARRALAAGLLRSAVVPPDAVTRRVRRAHAAGRRIARRAHDAAHGRVSAAERRAVQRAYDGQGVLQHVHASRRRGRVARRDDGRRRSRVSDDGARHEHAVQEGSEPRRVESAAL
jgi:hypothetical protein